MKTLKPEKFTIELRLINQKVDKTIIEKVVNELYRSSIPLTTLINFIATNKN